MDRAAAPSPEPQDAVPTLLRGGTGLRGFTPADAAAFAALHRDPLNVIWAGSDATLSEAAARALIVGAIAEGWATGDTLRFAVTDERAGGVVVGTTSLQGVFRSDDGGAASVGIKLLAGGRGHGHAARAIELLCGYAFDTLGLQVLHWRASVGNEPSRTLAERTGFELAAVIPGYGHVAGRISDGWLFTQTRQQWRDRPREGARPAAVNVPRLGDGTLTLRGLRADDAEQLVRISRDPEAVRWTTIPLDYTLDHAESFIHRITVAGWRSGETRTFAVADAGSDALLGVIDLQCKAPGTASVGINMGPQARGTGTAERAVRLLADYAFTQLNLSFLHWHALVPNWGSRKLAWKLGFRLEAEIRGDYNDRGTPADRWVLTLAAGDPRTPQDPWEGPPPPAR